MTPYEEVVSEFPPLSPEGEAAILADSDPELHDVGMQKMSHGGRTAIRLVWCSFTRNPRFGNVFRADYHVVGEKTEEPLRFVCWRDEGEYMGLVATAIDAGTPLAEISLSH